MSLLLAALAVGGRYLASLNTGKSTVDPPPVGIEPITSPDYTSEQPTPSAEQGNITDTGKFEPPSQPSSPGIPSA